MSGRDPARGPFAKPSHVARPELVWIDRGDRRSLAARAARTHRLRVAEDEHRPAQEEDQTGEHCQRETPVRLRVDDRVAEEWDRTAVDADLPREVDRLWVGD